MYKIFIIDDKKDNLAVFHILFRMLNIEYGFECELELINPEDMDNLEDYIIEQEPDILFLDIKLPEKSGIEILDSLRILGYDKPIIAQTASVTRSEVEIYTEIFSDGLIKKPVDDEIIINILKKHGIWNNTANKV